MARRPSSGARSRAVGGRRRWPRRLLTGAPSLPSELDAEVSPSRCYRRRRPAVTLGDTSDTRPRRDRLVTIGDIPTKFTIRRSTSPTSRGLNWSADGRLLSIRPMPHGQDNSLVDPDDDQLVLDVRRLGKSPGRTSDGHAYRRVRHGCNGRPTAPAHRVVCRSHPGSDPDPAADRDPDARADGYARAHADPYAHPHATANPGPDGRTAAPTPTPSRPRARARLDLRRPRRPRPSRRRPASQVLGGSRPAPGGPAAASRTGARPDLGCRAPPRPVPRPLDVTSACRSSRPCRAWRFVTGALSSRCSIHGVRLARRPKSRRSRTAARRCRRSPDSRTRWYPAPGDVAERPMARLKGRVEALRGFESHASRRLAPSGAGLTHPSGPA